MRDELQRLYKRSILNETEYQRFLTLTCQFNYLVKDSAYIKGFMTLAEANHFAYWRIHFGHVNVRIEQN